MWGTFRVFDFVIRFEKKSNISINETSIMYNSKNQNRNENNKIDIMSYYTSRLRLAGVFRGV